MTLKQKAIDGVKWTSLSNIVVAMLQLLQISVLARYLAPEDFGLMALATVVIGFSRIFSDMGVSNAIIHHQNTSHEQLSSLYWLNIAVGVCLFLLVSIASPWISLFYDEPRLTELLIILSSSFIILAIGNQYRVLFQKDLQFNLMAKIEIVAAVGAFVVAVVCAIAGFGVYSLVNATLTSTIIASVLYLFFGISTHRPSFVFRYDETKKYLGFGMYQTGQSTLNYFNSQFDVILIGKLLGAEALGIYSLVKQLAMRPVQVINPVVTKVAFPLMSKIQDDTVRLKQGYFKIVAMLSFVNLPIYGAIILLAPEIVHIMFGEGWNDSVIIVQILSLAFAIVAIGNPIGSLLMAKGKANWGFYWNLAQIFIVPFVVYFASIFGLSAVSWSIVGLKLFFMILAYPFMIKPLLDAKISDYIFSFLPSMLITSLAFVLIYYLPIDIDNTLGELLILSLLYGLLYTAISMVFNKQITKELILLVKKGK